MKKGDLVWATRIWSGKKGTVGIWKEVKPLLAVIYDDISNVANKEEPTNRYRLLIDGKKSNMFYYGSELGLVEDV